MSNPPRHFNTNWGFIKKHFIVPGLMLSLAMAVIVFSAAGCLRPGSVAPENWFSRGGAVVTVLSLLADIMLIRTSEFFKPRGFGSTEITELRKKFGYTLKWISRIAVALSIIGTMIWGYGDLIFVWMQGVLA